MIAFAFGEGTDGLGRNNVDSAHAVVDRGYTVKVKRVISVYGNVIEDASDGGNRVFAAYLLAIAVSVSHTYLHFLHAGIVTAGRIQRDIGDGVTRNGEKGHLVIFNVHRDHYDGVRLSARALSRIVVDRALIHAHEQYVGNVVVVLVGNALVHDVVAVVLDLSLNRFGNYHVKIDVEEVASAVEVEDLQRDANRQCYHKNNANNDYKHLFPLFHLLFAASVVVMVVVTA